MRRAVAMLVCVIVAAEASAQPVTPSPAPAPTPTPSPTPSPAPAPAARTLTLADALALARKQQPSLRRARASTTAAHARAAQASSAFHPRVTATAGYGLGSANTPRRSGTFSALLPEEPQSFKPYSSWDFGLSADQLVYDFGQVGGRVDAAEASAEAEQQNEQSALLDVEQGVRSAYFEASAARALLGVASETVLNETRHLQQIEGFVRAGARAEIDLYQVRTALANAKLQLIRAENDYATARAQLNQAMGLESGADYDVSDEALPAIAGEDGALEPLVKQAVKARPELAVLAKRAHAQSLTLDSIEGNYWPSLSASADLTEGGSELDAMAWNYGLGARLSWVLWEGDITDRRADEARAQLTALRAELDLTRQRLRLEVEQARLGVRGAKAALIASEEVVVNARERLRLAEGRYAAGAGSALELQDAQLVLTSALAERIAGQYTLARSRAALMRALGAR